MDSTAGDLNHAAQEMEANIEKQISNSPPERDFVGEKQDPHASSSGSSSHDDPALEKLDSKIVKVGEVKEGEEAYAHLPPDEKEIVKRQLDIPTVKVTFRTLYRYATLNDLIIVTISALCAITGGAVMPLMTVCPIAPFV
jgi:ATP-binding cassette subfamily B (MDR/TAP) protein 1